MVGNEFNGIGHDYLPGRFETGITLVAHVAFANFVAWTGAHLAETASAQHRPSEHRGSPPNPHERIPH
ncbi:hypothetical protein FZ025_20980 [Xanthomonas hyacinthi]|uniref:Uncharacterized protein n=1 Tax=Xanthomonas hyacinthi TaxID=56455 RepID=A0A2S7EQ28_9XANT|nr:hypothetical protein XhyaCFBP1156_19500 [Xanthomonas hyacinthi]QGY78967.1 hypothetical protein FZ025_20980 [Xanthomonas hyacinthi]